MKQVELKKLRFFAHLKRAVCKLSVFTRSSNVEEGAYRCAKSALGDFPAETPLSALLFWTPKMWLIFLCWKECENFLKLKSLVVHRGKLVSFLLSYKYCRDYLSLLWLQQLYSVLCLWNPSTGSCVTFYVNVFILVGISKPDVLEQGTEGFQSQNQACPRGQVGHKKRRGFTIGQFLALPRAGCVTSWKLLYLSEPLIHHLKNGYYAYFYRDILKIKWGSLLGLL